MTSRNLLLIFLSFGIIQFAQAQCLSGDCQNGKGTLRLKDGSKYEGHFKNGKREGQGTLTYRNGDIVTGQWHNDRLNGKAELIKANGDRFDGNWKNNAKYGQGKYEWKDGSSYIGEWYSNRRYGKGIMNYPNGSTYNGQWVDDKYDGSGSFGWKSGETFVGSWQKNIPKKGIFAFPNGDRYEGSWVKRTQNGQTQLAFFSNGKRIVNWQGADIQDVREKIPAEDTTSIVESDSVEEESTYPTETNKPTPKDSNTVTPKDETDSIADAFSAFEKKYRENFNMVMRELEAEKQFLIERGIKIRDEIENIARRLESESFSKDEKNSLEEYLKSLEEALVVNELAFQDARQKTTDVINKMRNTILAQDTKIEVIEKEKEKEQERLRFFAIIATLAIAISLVLFMIYRKIDTQKGEIELQSALIAKKNQDITASINYARRIQMAALPPTSQIYQALPESFIFFEPRDIVSGDFYWFTQLEDTLFIAALDCTGHGVPGAFMSLIGNKLLNEIIITKKIHEVDLILNELHKGIFKSLKQDENITQDGMDISICRINTYDRTLEFAGAGQPLFMIQNGELQEIKGDRIHIGGLQKSLSTNSFSKKIIQLSDETEGKQYFYIFSDGFRDQFGDGTGKYGKKRFKELLLRIHQEPMKKQRITLRNEFLDWKGKEKQLDDILVIGFQA
ncbi:MAG: SpoIIE family protein phosphatase [Flammeovirgaceae bacterium]